MHEIRFASRPRAEQVEWGGIGEVGGWVHNNQRSEIKSLLQQACARLWNPPGDRRQFRAPTSILMLCVCVLRIRVYAYSSRRRRVQSLIVCAAVCRIITPLSRRRHACRHTHTQTPSSGNEAHTKHAVWNPPRAQRVCDTDTHAHTHAHRASACTRAQRAAAAAAAFHRYSCGALA